jgi:hypothetical protein
MDMYGYASVDEVGHALEELDKYKSITHNLYQQISGESIQQVSHKLLLQMVDELERGYPI